MITASARRVVSPRQQIAQQRGAGAKERKRDNRDTDFQNDGKRPIRGVPRAEYLDQRSQQTNAGAVGSARPQLQRSRVANSSPDVKGAWKHGSGQIAPLCLKVEVNRLHGVVHDFTTAIRSQDIARSK